MSFVTNLSFEIWCSNLSSKFGSFGVTKLSFWCIKLDSSGKCVVTYNLAILFHFGNQASLYTIKQ